VRRAADRPGRRPHRRLPLARALADGEISLEPGVDADEAERALLGIRGIGPWTAAYIRMRGLADRDVFLATDLGVRHALAALGAADAATIDERWRPWRSYAVQQLWASLA
jgi:AraC family transcriptional regulator of adaptative response / DNA-3-methyladenine glycosylase II